MFSSRIGAFILQQDTLIKFEITVFFESYTFTANMEHSSLQKESNSWIGPTQRFVWPVHASF